MAEVRKDIAAMDEEKEQLAKRIERLQRKASSMPKQEEMLEAARNLRKEKDRLVLHVGMHQMPTIMYLFIHQWINFVYTLFSCTSAILYTQLYSYTKFIILLLYYNYVL